MKTIEIDSKQFWNYKHKKRLLMTLLPILKRDYNFHFLFEPNLIIRTNFYKDIIGILKKTPWKYKVYAYPYPKKGFGESKKYKKIQKDLEKILHIQSVCVLTYKQRDIDFFSNRLHHCLLNMLGFEYYDEAKYYLNEAQGYMGHEYKSEGKPYMLVLQKLIKLLYKIL